MSHIRTARTLFVTRFLNSIVYLPDFLPGASAQLDSQGNGKSWWIEEGCLGGWQTTVRDRGVESLRKYLNDHEPRAARLSDGKDLQSSSVTVMDYHHRIAARFPDIFLKNWSKRALKIGFRKLMLTSLVMVTEDD